MLNLCITLKNALVWSKGQLGRRRPILRGKRVAEKTDPKQKSQGKNAGKANLLGYIHGLYGIVILVHQAGGSPQDSDQRPWRPSGSKKFEANTRDQKECP